MSEIMDWGREHFGLEVTMKSTAEERREAARELLRAVPLFEELAGPGDGGLGADLLVDGTVKILEFFLSTIRPAATTFHSRAAHTMFSVEMLRAFVAQLQSLESLLIAVTAEHVGEDIAALPPEKQKEVHNILLNRAAASLQRLMEREMRDAALN